MDLGNVLGAEKFNTKKGFVGFDIVCPFRKNFVNFSVNSSKKCFKI